MIGICKYILGTFLLRYEYEYMVQPDADIQSVYCRHTRELLRHLSLFTILIQSGSSRFLSKQIDRYTAVGFGFSAVRLWSKINFINGIKLSDKINLRTMHGS